MKTNRYRIEYFKGKKERRLNPPTVVPESKKRGEGLTQREQEILKKFILGQGDVVEGAESSDEEKEEKKTAYSHEEYLDNMSLLIYNGLASEE